MKTNFFVQLYFAPLRIAPIKSFTMKALLTTKNLHQIRPSSKFWLAFKMSLFFLIGISSQMYAQTWSTGTVEQGDGCSWMWSSVATDANGNFFLIYEAMPSTNSTYKLAAWNGTTWNTITSFDETDVPNFNHFSDDVDMVIDANGHHHITFRGSRGSGVTSTRGVWYGLYNGANWSFTEVETYSDPNGWKNANDPSIAIDGNNQPYIAFEFTNSNNPRQRVIKYASKNGGSWTVENAYTQTGSNEVGYPDIEIDANGDAHIAFQRETNGSGLDGSLAYMTNKTGSWVVETAVSGVEDNISGFLPKIQLYNSAVYIAHSRGDFNGFRTNLATNESGSWVDEVVSSGGGESHALRDFVLNDSGLLFLTFMEDDDPGVFPDNVPDLLKYAYKNVTDNSWNIGTIATESDNGDIANYTGADLNNAGTFMTVFMNFINAIDDHCSSSNPFNPRQLDYATTSIVDPCAPTSNNYVWTGCENRQWHNTNNWQNGMVPSATSDVTIPNVTKDPIVSTSNAVAKSITIQNGGLLTVGSNGILTVGGSNHGITNNGQVTNSGTLRIGNTVENGIINQGSGASFTNEGTLNIGGTGNIGVYSIFNDAPFTNNGTFIIKNIGNRGIFNAGNTMTNNGLMKADHSGQYTNNATFINNGVLNYLQTTTIPNVTNNKIIVRPKAVTGCPTTISNAFGGTVTNVTEVFSNSGATNSAGTYSTSNNTFTPSTALMENENRTFYVKVNLSGTNYIAEWKVSNSGSCSNPEIAVSGNNQDITDGDSSPSTVDNTNFGSTLVNSGTVVRTFTIENTGSSALNLSGSPKVSLSGAQASSFSVTQQPAATVAANGGTTTFQITFAPTTASIHNATVSITNNDADENPFNFNIRGFGTTNPEISLEGNGHNIADGATTTSTNNHTDFGSTEVASGTVVRTFTVKNTGSAELTLNGSPKVAISGTDATDFSVTTQPISPVAANNGSQTFQITFDPSATGVRNATVSIANDDSDENPFDFAISGTGTVAAPTATATGTNATCQAGTTNSNDDGKITIAGFAATDKYQYSMGFNFDPGNAIPSSPTTIPNDGIIVDDLANAFQTYAVRITNTEGGFVDRSVKLLLTDCSCTNPVLTNLTDETICAGGSFTASKVTTSVSNGVTVNYQWYNDNGTDNANTNAINGQTTATLTALPIAVGTYKYRVEATRTDDATCQANKTVTLVINALPIATAMATNATCQTGSSTANSDGKITTANFAASDKFQYSTGNTFDENNATPATATTIPAGGVIVNNLANATQSYTVRITNTNSCSIDRVVNLMETSCSCPSIIYVNKSATGTNTGESWVNAFVNLQDALALDCSTGIQIWVAAGTYYPDEGTEQTENDRFASFLINNNLQVIGGFEGNEAEDFDINQRDLAMNVTILSGDIDQNDVYPTDLNEGNNTIQNNTANSYHVVTIANTITTNVLLDGLIIEGGYIGDAQAGRTGAGILNNGMLTLDHCQLKFNTIGYLSGNFHTKSGRGAGLYNGINASVGLTDCIFEGNSVDRGRGGAMHNDNQGIATLTDCIFKDNYVTGGRGGGLHNGIGGMATLTNCDFLNNYASHPFSQSSGGGMYNERNATANLIGCTFRANYVNSFFATGGGLNNNSEATAKLTNCIFEANYVRGGSKFGGGVYNNNATGTFVNCVFKGNSIIGTDNQSAVGGGLYTLNSNNIRLYNCSFSGNNTNKTGGAIYNKESDLILSNCILWNNKDQSGIGTASATIFNENSSFTATHSLIQGWDFTEGDNLEGTDASNNPLFATPVDPANAPTTEGNLQLLACSPVLNLGNNAADLDGDGVGTLTIADIETDLAGNPRIFNKNNSGIIDLGAYEYQGNIFVPTATAAATDATCQAGTSNSNNDGKITISNFATSDKYQYSTGATFDENNAIPATATTISNDGIIVNNLANANQSYTVRITNSDGCFVDRTVSLTETDCDCVTPVLSNLTDENICLDGSFTTSNVTTSVTNNVAVTYQWYNDNGTDNPNTIAINGQTTATLTALPTAVGSYSYRVEATNANDATCTASKTVNLTIYPNLTAGLTSSDADNTINRGESVTFTATGGNRYEFFVNNQVVQANGSMNTYTTTVLADGDKVKVRVSNTVTTCSEETDEIAMTVNCAARFYVDKNATAGTNTGASWENAFTELQTALKFACNGAEIWVAKGTYYPDEGSGITNNNRNSRFNLLGNQTVIGGFVGNEPADYDITLRDFDNNKTILSGDIDQNDIDVNDFTNFNFPRQNNGANTKRVVTIANRGAQPVVLDGFTIEGGKADLGAGIFITNSSNVTIRNCHINRNEGDCGSGVAVRISSHADFIDCTFSYNASTSGFAEGGGLEVVNNSSAELDRCVFYGNKAERSGAISIYNMSNVTAKNSLLVNNFATSSVGAAFITSGTALTLINSTVSGNYAGGDLGGLSVQGELSLQNSIVVLNRDDNAQMNDDNLGVVFGGSLELSHSLVEFRDASEPGNLDGNDPDHLPQFMASISANTFPTALGDYRLLSCSPLINAGSNALNSTGTDLADSTRIIDGTIDLGAYEYQAEQIAATATNATCQTGTSASNNDGKIKITNFSASDKYQYSEGTTFDANNAIPATAANIPTNGVIVNNLTNAAKSYTVRITSTNGCTVDRTVSITLTSCSCTAPTLVNIPNQSACDRTGSIPESFDPVQTSVTNGVTVSYQWYNANGTNNANTNAISGQTTRTLTALPTTPGSYTYRVEATRTDDATCKASKTVTLVIHAKPTVTFTSSDADNTINQGESVTFTATGGTQYEFYVNNSPAQTFSTDNTFTTTTLQDGDVVSTLVLDGNNCSTFTNDITMTVITSNDDAEAGPDQSNICGTIAQLAAEAPQFGTGQWTATPAGGSFIDATNPTTQFQGTLGGTYTLTWTVTGASDQVQISFSGDADNDTVQDCIDLCPGGDDRINSDGEGMPDACDCDANDPRDETVSLPGEIITKTDLDPGLYQSSMAIYSTAHANPDKTIVFKAGKEIVLEEGFHAQAGTDFLAQIEYCNFPGNALVKSETEALRNVLQEALASNGGNRIAPTTDLGGTLKNNHTLAIEMKIGPNPFRHATTAFIDLPKATTASLMLFDARGQLIKMILHQAQLPAGQHRLPLIKAPLPAGIYFVHLRTTEGSVVQQVISVR